MDGRVDPDLSAPAVALLPSKIARLPVRPTAAVPPAPAPPAAPAGAPVAPSMSEVTPAGPPAPVTGSGPVTGAAAVVGRGRERPTTVTRPGGPVARRPPAEARRPYHVGVALGLTAGVYAASLAAVSVLQIDRDRHLIADREPVMAAIQMLGYHHDDMTADLETAGAVFEDASSRYSSMAADLQKLHADVAQLSRKLQAIDALTSTDGSGLGGVTVGGGGRLPSVAKTAPKAGGGASAPTTSATTGASGAP